MEAIIPISDFSLPSVPRPRAPRPANRAPGKARDLQLTALMCAAQRGDQLAYANLLREVTPLLQRFVRGQFPYLQAADRDDVIQDVFLSLHSSIASYDPCRAFVPWLRTIAHNRGVDRSRRSSRLTAREILVDEWDTIEPVGDLAPYEHHYSDLESLRRAMRQLSPKQFRAVLLLKIHGKSPEEAANITGMSIGALRVAVHRAIRSLRVSLRGGQNNDHGVAYSHRRAPARELDRGRPANEDNSRRRAR